MIGWDAQSRVAAAGRVATGGRPPGCVAAPRCQEGTGKKMLQSIHDKLKGWLAGVVLSAIGLVFVFWGINWTLSAPNYAAKVNGVEISSSEVREAYQRQLAQFE